MTKYGYIEGPGLGTGIASRVPTQLPAIPYPGYTPPTARQHDRYRRVQYREVNSAVGLRSVDQLTLYAQISDIEGMTEVYNVMRIGRINNHFVIPQKD